MHRSVSQDGNSQKREQRRFFRQSIELPVAVSVGKLPAPVYATLMNISETGCRFRSLILIERDKSVDFELQRPGRSPLHLSGSILQRTNPEIGGGYEYGVEFRHTNANERDALAREVLDIQRREAKARSEAREQVAQPAGDRYGSSMQRRSSVRTNASFPIRYRVGDRIFVVAEANDVSTGGLRLICGETLPTGSELELEFTLPSNVLDVYPKAAERTEISPFGPRRVRLPDNRRPFEEMALRGRVVARFEPINGREIYGLQFIDIDGYQREEIARFTHAAQLLKLRTTA